jgi:DNA-binding Xre family transcriptional regulator
MIYFVQRANGNIKIGFTDNIKDRLRSLQGAYDGVELLGIMEGDRATEKALHNQFRFCWVEGEFFVDTFELLEYIAEHATPFIVPTELNKIKGHVRNNLIALMAKRQLEVERLINLYDIADDVDWSMDELRRLYNGTMRSYNLEKIERLCRYFKCEVGDLLYVEFDA